MSRQNSNTKFPSAGRTIWGKGTCLWSRCAQAQESWILSNQSAYSRFIQPELPLPAPIVAANCSLTLADYARRGQPPDLRPGRFWGELLCLTPGLIPSGSLPLTGGAVAGHLRGRGPPRSVRSLSPSLPAGRWLFSNISPSVACGPALVPCPVPSLLGC